MRHLNSGFKRQRARSLQAVSTFQRPPLVPQQSAKTKNEIIPEAASVFNGRLSNARIVHGSSPDSTLSPRQRGLLRWRDKTGLLLCRTFKGIQPVVFERVEGRARGYVAYLACACDTLRGNTCTVSSKSTFNNRWRSRSQRKQN